MKSWTYSHGLCNSKSRLHISIQRAFNATSFLRHITKMGQSAETEAEETHAEAVPEEKDKW